MKSCAICGSHAFNMATEGVNQGAFCDRHYWQRKAEASEAARATPALPQGVEEAVIEKALRLAFNLGQTYWQQADSESYSQNRKSVETLQKFNALVVETSSKLSGMAIVPVERLKYLNDHHHATESGVGLARLALSRSDTQRAIEALNSTSEKLDGIIAMLAAAKEKQL